VPKDTFYNLPEEKRELIEEVSMDEFAAYNYEQSSINRIIKAANIAKGSFYQYFEDKTDLFRFIISKAVEEKIKYITPVMMNPSEHNFFKVVREMYISGLRFAIENPRLVTIGNRFLNEKDNPIYQEILGENMVTSYQIFDGLLKAAIQRGEVRPDIDTKFISHMISEMNVLTVTYYQDVVKEGKKENGEWDDDIMETVDMFLDFLENGISAIKKGGNTYD